jgi:hypothetical protein
LHTFLRTINARHADQTEGLIKMHEIKKHI